MILDMTKILAFSGKRSSGKNTTFNFLLGIELLRLAVVRDKIAVRDDGMLWISDLFGNNDYEGVYDIDRNTNAVKELNHRCIYPFIRNYSFADLLKQEVCMKILGLSYEQCYGTDEQKKSLTHLKWEDMPGVTTQKGVMDLMETREVRGRLGKYHNYVTKDKLVYHYPGFMTAREVMQFVGSEIFRKMWGDVWAKGTIRNILEDPNPTRLAVITDTRFPNEVEAVKEVGGKVIRFLRSPFNDNHISETSLDDYPHNKYDAVIDNSDMTVSEQNEAVYKKLKEWEWMDTIQEKPIEV